MSAPLVSPLGLTRYLISWAASQTAPAFHLGRVPSVQRERADLHLDIAFRDVRVVHVVLPRLNFPLLENLKIGLLHPGSTCRKPPGRTSRASGKKPARRTSDRRPRGG